MSAVRVRRQKFGQSLIETMVGIIFLVPIVLFLFDVAVVVLANSANDNLAKSCARAAAGATAVVNGSTTGTKDAAFQAAKDIAKNFATSALIHTPGGGTDGTNFVQGFAWIPEGSQPPMNSNNAKLTNPGRGQVAVLTTMEVQLPVPFPGFDKINFDAKAVEPIVSLPPQ